MEGEGLLELPVVQRTGEDGDAFRMVSGEHRFKAWLSLGNKEVPCVVAPKQYEREKEFELVQNFNLIRGKVTLGAMRQVIAEHELDASKINLHGVPAWAIGGEKPKQFEDAKKRQEDQMRVKALALQIASSLAMMILEERDEDGMLVCEAGGKAVVMAGFSTNVKWLRSNSSEVKKQLRDMLEGMEGWSSGMYQNEEEDEVSDDE